MSSYSTEFAEPEVNLRGVRVLVVEDVWHVATALDALLRDVGMEVIGPAATIIDAERLAAKHRPELAVIDINLKGEMAYDLIDQLHGKGVHIVVVTGYLVLRPAMEKIAAVVHKPFDGPEMLAALHRAAERRSRARSPESC